ncbi:hypothetical protein GWI33_012141 [Rhynchophorus ferrugineus]|uniref:Uncharacterized protein n=1 Tax=Rhynchophorus ferrugineus TaxID=354439 RepID=A0A834MCQ4_RHYFE|nr:hypothetical protein GWI33_012141 [Rhynchophorus ferrugineus]
MAEIDPHHQICFCVYLFTVIRPGFPGPSALPASFPPPPPPPTAPENLEKRAKSAKKHPQHFGRRSLPPLAPWTACCALNGPPPPPPPWTVAAAAAQ